jgi:hypothetical protein
MSRFISVVWTLQFCVLLWLTVMLAAWPLSVPSFLFGCKIDRSQAAEAVFPAPLPIDQCVEPPPSTCSPKHPLPLHSRDAKYIIAAVRLLTPFIFALAIFTLHALRREDERVRRRFAAVFAVFGAALCYELWEKGGIFWITLVFTTLQMAYAAMQLREPRRLSGMADTRPPELWVVWVIQGLVFLAAASVVWRQSIYGYLIQGETPDDPSHIIRYGRLLDSIDELTWPFFLAIALFSFLGMSASRQWSWRSFCRIFAILYGVWFLVFLFIWDGTVFETWVLLLWVPILGAAVIHGVYWFKTDIWFAEEVGEGPDGWIISDLVVGALLLLQTLLTRRRPHYTRGVAVRCRFESVSDETVPSEPAPMSSTSDGFFEKGASSSPQSFEVVVRFSTDGPDDAGLASRGAALQLVNWRRERFDLMLSTGAFMGAENLVEFTLVHLARRLGGNAQRWLMRRWLRLREAVVAELRRAPSCYTHLSYYSQTVRFWNTGSGDRQLVRYRLVPLTKEAIEPCLGIEKDQERFSFRRAEGEWRPPDYLKQVLKRRIESKSLKMQLEAQFHDPENGTGVEWFNPSVDWSPLTHPWKRLGVVVLERALPDTEGEALCFNPAIVPAALGTPVSPHVLDPRSIADAERRVHRRVQDTRMWLMKVLGPPRLRGMPQDER